MARGYMSCFDKIGELVVLGDHYHPKGITEQFVVTEGGGWLVRQEVNPETNEAVGEMMIEAVSPGSLVWVEPNTAHTFILTPGSAMLCFSVDDPEKRPARPFILVGKDSGKIQAFLAEHKLTV